MKGVGARGPEDQGQKKLGHQRQRSDAEQRVDKLRSSLEGLQVSSNDGLDRSVTASSPSFELELTPHQFDVSDPSRTEKIVFSVPNLEREGLKLTKALLPVIFQRCTDCIYNVKYKVEPARGLELDGKDRSYWDPDAEDPDKTRKAEMTALLDTKIQKSGQVHVWRPNHNAAHAMRKARMMQVMMSMVMEHGTDEAKLGLTQLGEQGQLHLVLGAFMHRAGRVNERSWRGGGAYGQRSAELYGAVVKQLGPDETPRKELLGLNVRQYVQHLIRWANKPPAWEQGLGQKVEWAHEEGEAASQLPIDLYAKQGPHRCLQMMFSAVHSLDLMRCWGARYVTEAIPEIKTFVAALTGADEGKVEELTQTLVQLSKELCDATGARRRWMAAKDDKAAYGHTPTFAICSTDASIGWQRCQSANNPFAAD